MWIPNPEQVSPGWNLVCEQKSHVTYTRLLVFQGCSLSDLGEEEASMPASTNLALSKDGPHFSFEVVM